VAGGFYINYRGREREREGGPVRVSSKRGAPSIEGGFVLAEEK
jgi:hypothetical protein